MAKVTKIHESKQPRRPHFIPDWAERRHLNQADIARETGADKSIISRWFNGATPSVDWQVVLVGLFELDSRDDLFRSPDEHWMKRLFIKNRDIIEILNDRTDDELKRIRQMLEAAFPPKKDGTNG
jgi:transcriptional regulator with XRE-family HTH domain